MDNEPLTTYVPQRFFTAYARKSTTGENYPGTPVTDSVPQYLKRFEWLSDERGSRRYNPCSHYRKVVSLDRPLSDGSDTWVSPANHALGYWNVDYVTTPFQWGGARYGAPATYGLDSSFGAWENPFTGLPLLYATSPITGRYIVTPTEKDIENLIDRSLLAMLPGIKPRVSLLNSLYELKDMKTMVRTVKRLSAAVGSAESLKEAYRLPATVYKLLSGRNRREALRVALRSITKAGSDSYLQTQFNILPLLKDIEGVQSSILRVKKELKDLLDNAGRTQTSHFRAPLRNNYVASNTTKSIAIPNSFVNSLSTGRREVKYPTAMFYATMEYRYKMPYAHYSPEDYLPLAIYDSLGLNWNPAILWNAMKWTFLIDWVVGVSRWLDQFKLRNIEPVTSISRYCYSLHVVREITLSHSESATPVPFARIEEEAYIRKPHRPDLYRSIELSGLNPKEFTLAGALALSR
jgi:hypothetical protein